MAEYRPENQQPENPGMGPWLKTPAPAIPLKPGTVDAPLPPKHDGSADYPRPGSVPPK
jgi:hypothetical protein